MTTMFTSLPAELQGPLLSSSLVDRFQPTCVRYVGGLNVHGNRSEAPSMSMVEVEVMVEVDGGGSLRPDGAEANSTWA